MGNLRDLLAKGPRPQHKAFKAYREYKAHKASRAVKVYKDLAYKEPPELAFQSLVVWLQWAVIHRPH